MNKLLYYVHMEIPSARNASSNANKNDKKEKEKAK